MKVCSDRSGGLRQRPPVRVLVMKGAIVEFVHMHDNSNLTQFSQVEKVRPTDSLNKVPFLLLRRCRHVAS